MKIFILTFLVIFVFNVHGQKNELSETTGLLSLGTRTTVSMFNGNSSQESSSLGLGGQFRIRLSNRVNTEWFFDYLPATNQFSRRTDYHIGWSVLYYLRNQTRPFFQPYALAGHCFDYTYRSELKNSSNNVARWSGAIQAGFGTHFNLTNKLDVSVNAQYMIHLGTHIHEHMETSGVVFEQGKGGALEGHLLLTFSLNYNIGRLWGGK